MKKIVTPVLLLLLFIPQAFAQQKECILTYGVIARGDRFLINPARHRFLEYASSAQECQQLAFQYALANAGSEPMEKDMGRGKTRPYTALSLFHWEFKEGFLRNESGYVNKYAAQFAPGLFEEIVIFSKKGERLYFREISEY